MKKQMQIEISSEVNGTLINRQQLPAMKRKSVANIDEKKTQKKLCYDNWIATTFYASFFHFFIFFEFSLFSAIHFYPFHPNALHLPSTQFWIMIMSQQEMST